MDLFPVHVDNLEFLSLINILLETTIHPAFNFKCMKMEPKNMERYKYSRFFLT